jgi:phosphate-selective porin OprO/OprP
MRRIAVSLLVLAPSLAAAQSDTTDMFSMQRGRPTLTLGGGEFVLQPAFRLDLDGGTFWDQPQTDGRPARYDNGTNVRRGRLGLQGSVLRDFTYNMTWQFEPGPGNQFDRASVHISDLWVAYGGLSWATIRVGAYTPLHTLEFSGSSFETLFMERGTVGNLAGSIAAGDSRWAAGGEVRTDRLFGSFYVTNGQSTTRNDGQQRGIAGRVAGLAVDTDGFRLLVGGSASYQFEPGTTNNQSLRLRDFPQLRLSPLRLLDTRALGADSGFTFGPEVSGTIGKLLFQAEYQRIQVDRSNGTSPTFEGLYGTLAYPLIGAGRRYDRNRAAWTRPSFQELDLAAGHWGYLEVATRFSYANLFDGAVRGGRQNIWSTALNYYPYRSLRASVEYQLGQITLDGPNRSFQSIGFRLAYSL